ncbi:MAG TPA: ferrochelatase [Vicinamibacteria bacterium]|nr:ferrochelatase [Vicinamibacteria bacterium]
MRRSVVLVNLGTTSAPEPDAVRAFLSEFLSDPMVVDYPTWLWAPILKRILASRPSKVAEQYRSIWTDEGSPLHIGSRRIAEALSAALAREVRIAYRYGEPSLASTLDDGCLVIPLFPQRTGSTTGTIEKLVGERATVRGVRADASGYVDAQADLWERAVGEDTPEHVVVSFHGIPARYDRAEGGRYRRDCEATFRALLGRLGWPEKKATLAFQSRFGPEPWIGPSTAKTLERLARSGTRSVAVMTPGFATEGLETVEEIGIRGRKTFLDAGGERFVRVPCVEAHPAFVRALVEVVREEEA